MFSGSIIRRGEIGALIYATGTHTYFGKTAELVQDAHTVTKETIRHHVTSEWSSRPSSGGPPRP